MSQQLGNYKGAAADLGQAQKIDYSPSVAKDLTYVQKRVVKIGKLKLRDEASAAMAAAAEGGARPPAPPGEESK